MSVVPQSYIRTGRKAKNIVAKMLNVPEQMKGFPSKIWNQFSFYSKLSSLEAVGRNGAATAFYSGKYDIKLQLDKSEVPMIGKDQIDIKKLQNQIMGAIEEARKHNHVHKYYEKSLYQISNDNSPKAETFSKPTHYASKRSEIKQDLTTLQEDDENQYMFKKVLQQMQKMDMEYQKDIQEYKKYLVKKDDLESVNRDEINSRVVFSSAFHDLANSLPASEANNSDVKDMTTQLSEDSSRITDRIIDTEGTTFQSIHSLTYDSRLDPDAEPIGPFMHELIALKKLEQQVEEYEQEHGKGTFAKYMIESASNDMHTIYSSLESLEEAFSPEGREMWAKLLFATNADENVAPIMEAVENIDPKLCASLPVTVVEEEVEEEK